MRDLSTRTSEKRLKGIGARDPNTSFSVLIPAYQAAEFIAEAIASALQQTFPPLEVVVCDDGSTDRLDNAIAPYLGQITLLRQENLGKSAALNNAARHARGTFVVLLDADDFWLPQRLERMAEAIEHDPEPDIITTNAWVRRAGRPDVPWYGGFIPNTFPSRSQQRVEILHRNFIYALAAIRRSRWIEINGADETLRIAQDYDLWVRLILSGSSAILVPEPLSVYRLHGANITSDRLAHLMEDVRILQRASRFDLTTEEQSALRNYVEDLERRIRLIQAQHSVLEGQADAQSRCFAVLRDRRQSLGHRLKAALSMLFPGASRRFARRNGR